ncbi:MAG: hypothetical protein R3A10_02170 [Caldilineaceae bacterium]
MLLPYVDNVVNVALSPALRRLHRGRSTHRHQSHRRLGCAGSCSRDRRVGCRKPVAFAAAVARLLADPVQMNVMGQRAYDLAHGEFSWQTLGAEVLAFYSSLLAQNS